jgi:hypothetical protein
VLVRQQRDLFSGGPSPTLGIPDVTTHVGSVIHAFETLAQQRQLKDIEKIYESSKSTSSSNRKESMHKIILPPPPPTQKSSSGTQRTIAEPMRHIVRHRPKGRAPDIPINILTLTATQAPATASAPVAPAKFSGDENESSALDSLTLEDDYRRGSTTDKFPQSFVKSYKVMPPFVPPHQPSRIPTKAINKASSAAARNRMSADSLLLSKTRTDVFLKPTKYTEDDVENDFLRGTTVSQSFIKNVVRKSPTRKMSTYEQNFLVSNDDTHNALSSGLVTKAKRKSVDRSVRDSKVRSSVGALKIEQPLIDEVSKRYKEYTGNGNNESSRQYNFQPRSIDRAEL